MRFYKREGLLERPARRPSGYRQYEPKAIGRLRFIKRAQRLGFTLREIKELLSLKLDPHATRKQVKVRTIAKIADIDQRIDELKRIKKALVPMARTEYGSAADRYHGDGDSVPTPRLTWGVGMGDKTIRSRHANA